VSGAGDAAATTGRPLADSAARFLFGYVRRRPWQFALLLGLTTGAASSSVAVQYGMKLIVDTMSVGDRGSSVIWRWLALFVSLIAMESALWRIGGWLGCRVVVATGVDVRLDLFRHLAGHPMRYFTAQSAGALGNRVTATAGSVGALLGTLTWRVLPPVIDFLGAIIVLVSIDLRMAAALVVFAALAGSVMTALGVRGRPLHQEYARKGSAVSGDVVDVVSNIWTIKAFSAAEREYRRLRIAFEDEADAQRSSWLYLEKARMVHDVFLWAMAGGMLVWAIVSWRAGTSTSGDVVVISALTFRILHGSRDLALSLVDASQQFGVIGEMLGVVAGPHGVADAPGAPRFERGRGAIQLRGVQFRYPHGQQVLDGLDLDIPAGQRCGIVGASGAGKSTLLALLQRLDDVDGGRISIDGQDIRTVQQTTLRAALAVVPQDIALLHRTLIENVRYGRPDASDDEVYDAARNAGCEDFIRALPQGWQTVVGERGSKLSGGQRQRVGIARAFLKRAPILLLDEATSALDSDSEAQIRESLDRLMKGRTVIAVAHRLSTLVNFDRIVLMEHGRIIEDGCPEALLEAGGAFSRLWKMQSSVAPPDRAAEDLVYGS
jgi:ATP-binding cassette subfamily B protein